jgi:alpha-1,3-rhamnosyl/mannosyltransferase
MRVALDATPLVLETGGLARYAAELSVALAEQFPDDDFSLFSGQPFPMPRPARRNLTPGRQPRNAFERRWWTWGVQHEMRRLHCDVFHGTNFEVPYLPLRASVATVHDLSAWMNPEWHQAADRVRKRTPPLLRMGIATMVITPSEAVRRHVIDYFRLPASRVAAVPLGAAEVFRPVAVRDRPPYFLYAGTLEPRKNLQLLLDAWRAMRRRYPVDLVLAGHRRSDFPQPSPEPGLQLTGKVSDAELAQLYSGALAVVYPSHYEGFGLPVLEAMQCGACVFISKDAALREVAGEAGISLDGAGAWAETMCAAAANPEWVRTRRKMSLERARAFSWAATARLTREVYEEARRRFAS